MTTPTKSKTPAPKKVSREKAGSPKVSVEESPNPPALVPPSKEDTLNLPEDPDFQRLCNAVVDLAELLGRVTPYDTGVRGDNESTTHKKIRLIKKLVNSMVVFTD